MADRDDRIRAEYERIAQAHIDTPAGQCVHCGGPAKSAYCGAPPCKAARERWRYLNDPESHRARVIKNRPKIEHKSCVRCGNELRYSRNEEPVCRACYNAHRLDRRAEAAAERHRRENTVRARAERRAADALAGTTSPRIFVQGACMCCGEQFLAASFTAEARFCSARCSRRWHRKAGGVKGYTRLAVFERDGYTCHLCGGACDPGATVPHLTAPTVDHIVPRSKGGGHDADNLKTAHYICNVLRGDSDMSEWEVVA